MTKSFTFEMIYNSGYSSTSVDITTSGYTPIGVIGFILGSSYLAPSVMRVVGNTLNIEARNHTSPQATGTNNAVVYILYCKNQA